MKKTMTFVVSVVFLSASLALPSFAEVKAGTPCKQAGKVIQTAGMKYKCVKSGKKLVWGKGQLTVKATPTPTPTPTISACTGVANNNFGKFNVSLQMMDPFDTKRILSGGGIFLKVDSKWNYYGANLNGKIDFSINPGNFEISTLPPLRAEYYLNRKSYFLAISADGVFTIVNSKLINGSCQIYSELSRAGLERLSEVKKSDFKFSMTPIEVQRPESTVKYIAPKSNGLPAPITFDLYPWESKHLVLLTLRNDYDPQIIGRYLKALDLAYELYDETTSYFPKWTPKNSSWARTLNGKEVIAEIPDLDGTDSANIISCGGNACTAPSTLGIEIRWQALESTLWMLENLDVYDKILFYELGRTFWPVVSCEEKISLKENDPTKTGFAVFMGFEIMKSLGLTFGSEDNESGNSYYNRILGIERDFTANLDLKLNNLFQKDRVINGWDGNAIWASLMSYLGQNLGDFKFYKEFFSSCDQLQTPTSDLMTIQNWKYLAELAAGRNLDEIFIQRWRMP